MKKDVLIITGVVLVAVAIGWIGFLLGIEDLSGSGFNSSPKVSTTQLLANSMSFVPIKHGISSNVTRRVNYVITSNNGLDGLWELVNATDTPPRVDFKKQSIVAVFAGSGKSSQIKISDIKDTNVRTVSVKILTPNNSCTAETPKVTSPYEIVVMSATSLPLTHMDILATTTCKN